MNKPNKIHQADLLILPHDTYRKKTYKYALVVVDIKNKKELSEVAKAFEKIYSRKSRANRTLGEKIFTHQYAQEMADAQKSKNRSGEWVERLPAVLKVMNNEVTRLTGKEPASSI